MWKVVCMLAAAASMARAAPTGYQCVPGKAKVGVGCTCPAKFTSKQSDDGTATCRFTPVLKPVVKPAHAARPPAVELTPALAITSSRTKAAVVTDIVGLEKLYSQTDKADPTWAPLMRRLIAAYDELSYIALQDVLSPQDRKQAVRVWEAARKKAESYSHLLLDTVKTFPKRDEVLFHLALLYEARPPDTDPGDAAARRDDNTKAFKIYLKLIQEVPDSPLIFDVYVRFGDFFFKDAQYQLAIESYARAQYGCGEGCPLAAYAAYRQGFGYWYKNDAANAKEAFKIAIEIANQHSDQPKASDITADATKAIGEM